MIPFLARLLHCTILRTRICEATGPDGAIHRYLVETRDDGHDHLQRQTEISRDAIDTESIDLLKSNPQEFFNRTRRDQWNWQTDPDEC